MKKFLILFLSILLTFLLLPLSSFGKGLVPCGGEGEPSCQFCHFFVLFKNIVEFLLIPRADLNQGFPLVPLIAVLMMVIAGAMFFLYAEDPGKIQQARSLMKAVVVGLVLIYAAWLIVNLFFQIIGVESWTNLKTWWEIKGCP